MLTKSRLNSGNKLKTFAFYCLMLLGTIAIFGWIRSQGATLRAAPSQSAVVGSTVVGPQQIDTLLHVLLALCVVIVTARVMGVLFKAIGQPPVIGEVLGGILLGPSLLGRLSPEVYSYLLPQSAAPFLGVIAQLGVILYMFLVGLELDLKVLRRSGHATLAISHASIVVPFLLGAGLALGIYERMASGEVPFTSFALFLGVSLSVTAFPVLARILTDRNVSKTRMGTIALTCAAVDDVTAWCLLAFVASVAQARPGAAITTVLLSLGYIALMFVVFRPLIAKSIPFFEKFERLTEGGMAIVLVALLLSALATEFIGIHAIFGAFLLGAVTPHKSKVASDITDRLQDLVRIMFLPAFFAFTGMRTQIGLLGGAHDWILCGIIICVATLGKFGGTFFAARFAGLHWRDAASLGILMNTRGLVELIVLNLGLDLKVISPTLFAMLVLMALTTTFMTTPILHMLTRNHPWKD